MKRSPLFLLVLCAVASPASASSALTDAVAKHLEATVRLPSGAAALDRYARWYTTVRVQSVYDLPFSTIRDDVSVPARRSVVVGIYALRGGLWAVSTTGSHIVSKMNFPQFVHGGCDAVNVVYDPARKKVLGVWCNVDDRTSPPPPTGRR